MLEVKDTELMISFPEVNDNAVLRIHFRSPESPEDQVSILQHESENRLMLDTVGPVVMHLRPSFNETGPGSRYPFVILLSFDGRNVLTDKRSTTLIRNPQNYFSTPPQGGIDGYFRDGKVHPFRAGAEPFLNDVSLEIKVFPMKNETWTHFMYQRTLLGWGHPVITGLTLKHGGERQCEPVYEDLCCIGDWDQSKQEQVTIWLKGQSE